MKQVVKYDVYLDILLMVSIYVMKYELFKDNLEILKRCPELPTTCVYKSPGNAPFLAPREAAQGTWQEILLPSGQPLKGPTGSAAHRENIMKIKNPK